MRKVLPYLGAAFSALTMAWSVPVNAQEPFKDLDPNHWAYQAVKDLQEKGILIGYPNGYFAGKRTLTRYEFAVAIRRLLDKLPPPGQGPPGPQGEVGPQGPPGPGSSVTPEEIAEIRRLLDEFKNELAALGTDVRNVRSRLDALAADVADIKSRLDKMIQFSGDFFVGVRSDRSRFGFLDYSGAPRALAGGAGAGGGVFGLPGNQSIFDNVDSPHDFHLKAHAKLPNGITGDFDIVSSNYLAYRAPGPTNILSGGPAANPNGGPQQTTLYQAALNIPIGGIGSNTMLTVGRYKNQVTPLTFWRPDYDAYFDLPWYDDGNYVQDGVKFSSKFGSATTSIWAASYSSTTSSSLGTLNQPMFGTVEGPRFASGFKPFGITGFSGQLPATQSAGLHIGVPLFRWGEIGLTLIDMSAGAVPGSIVPYNNMVVYGANLKLNPIGRWRFSAEAAKSVTQKGIDTADGLSNEDNNAYLANVGWGSGGFDIGAGYQYIDPRFSAPGYWNKIGNWYNPTNVRGPFVRIGYTFNRDLSVHLGGDFLEGARNRNYAGTGGLSVSDNLQRVNAGVKWRINRLFDLGADYEGVFWDLSPGSSLTGANSKPVEQYLTFGVGYNLTSNTVLKAAYQIINFQDVGGGFTGVPGASSNASVFTTQVAVRF